MAQAREPVGMRSAQEGYVPDVEISSRDVEFGRPAPWMICRVMEMLCIHPPESVINVGDTLVVIESGRNAGLWSIGVAATGNETGLTEEDFAAMPVVKKKRLITAARQKLAQAGAHWIIDTMEKLPELSPRSTQPSSRGKTLNRLLPGIQAATGLATDHRFRGTTAHHASELPPLEWLQ